MNKNTELLDLMQKVGQDAIFFRGFMETYYGTKDIRIDRLRECQDAGLERVKQFKPLGISVSYISRLSRELKKANVVTGYRRKGNHYLEDGPNLNDFMDFLEEDMDYGTGLTSTSEEDVVTTHQALTILEEHGAIMAHRPGHTIPAKAYAKLQQKVAAGELMLAFIQPGLVAGVKFEGKTHRIRFYDE